jgi:hypothetical protein
MVAQGVAFSRLRNLADSASFLPRYLPAVIVMRKLSFPSQFSFGTFVTDRATKLQSLRSALASTPDNAVTAQLKTPNNQISGNPTIRPLATQRGFD